MMGRRNKWLCRILLAVVVTSIGVSGYFIVFPRSSQRGEGPELEPWRRVLSKATLSVNKQEFRSGDTLELTIRNRGLTCLYYGQPYTIEYFDEHWGWVEVPWLYPEVWLSWLRSLPPFCSYTQSTKLFRVFVGTYRISKEVTVGDTNISMTLTETFPVIEGTETFPAEVSAFARGIQLDVAVFDINPRLYDAVYVVSWVTNVNSSEPVFFTGEVIHMAVLNREGEAVGEFKSLWSEHLPASSWELPVQETRTVVHRWWVATNSTFAVDILRGETYYLAMKCKLQTRAGNSFEIAIEPIRVLVKCKCRPVHYPVTIPPLLSQYVAHEPISIQGDGDFAAFGFPGEGSVDNPYRIEGLNITSASHRLIHIEDTMAYFCIQNNLLNGLNDTWTGISLRNVSHGMITANFVSQCTHGILLWAAKQNLLSNNTLVYNEQGILLENRYWPEKSGQNTVTYNRIFNNRGDGMVLEATEQNIVTYNILSQNRGDGIHLSAAGRNILAHNRIVDNRGDGMVLEAAGLNLLSNNTIVYNEQGIVLEKRDGLEKLGQNILTQNTVAHNRDGGIFLNIAGQNMVTHNTVANNHWWAIWLAGSDNNTIAHNTLSQNELGIYLFGGMNNTVAHNALYQNELGIGFVSANNNTVTHNLVFQNNRGIYLDGSSADNLVTYNIIANNWQGIVLSDSGSGQNTLIHNTLFNNHEDLQTETHSKPSRVPGFGLVEVGVTFLALLSYMKRRSKRE